MNEQNRKLTPEESQAMLKQMEWLLNPQPKPAMILAANLGTPTQWFRDNSEKATAHAEDDYLHWGKTPTSHQLQGKVFQAISNNRSLQALILGFDYFSDEVMQITTRCLFTGIIVKLCDQSNRQTEQFNPLAYFPIGDANYTAWPTVDYPNTVTARTKQTLTSWQKENQAAYRQAAQAAELRSTTAQVFYDIRQLEKNPHCQERLNHIARYYHLASPGRYLLREINILSDEAKAFCMDVFEMQLPNSHLMTESEQLLAWLSCLYYLSADIEPTRQVELRFRAGDRANPYRVTGSVPVPV